MKIVFRYPDIKPEDFFKLINHDNDLNYCMDLYGLQSKDSTSIVKYYLDKAKLAKTHEIYQILIGTTLSKKNIIFNSLKEYDCVLLADEGLILVKLW